MMHGQRAEWQLPRGVPRGLWQYVHDTRIADQYDEYFCLHPMFEFDEAVVLAAFEQRRRGPHPLVADLGCGTGRALVALGRQGYRGLAVDLSEHMLEIVREKAELEQLPIHCLRANLVELDAISDASVDFAVCLFSTLGMIRGRACRRQALAHMHRILRPGGCLVLHVHNYWYNLYDPGGPWWLFRNLCRAVFVRDVETGDKFFPYRGVNRMFLHVFRRGEIRRDVQASGLRIAHMIPLSAGRDKALRLHWLSGSLRANGWMLICEKESPAR